SSHFSERATRESHFETPAQLRPSGLIVIHEYKDFRRYRKGEGFMLKWAAIFFCYRDNRGVVWLHRNRDGGCRYREIPVLPVHNDLCSAVRPFCRKQALLAS